MDTTQVLSMRSLTTLPTRIFLRLRSVVAVISTESSPSRGAAWWATPAASGLRRRLSLLLLQHGQHPCHFTPALADLERVVQLLHRVAEPQVEQLLAQLGDPRPEFVDAHLTQCS